MSQHSAGDDDATVPSRTLGVPVLSLRIGVTSGPDAGLVHVSHDEPVTVGTAPGNTIVLGDRTVSGYHLEIRRKEDRVAITDLGSTNGTSIGPVLVEDASVAAAVGTELTIGQTTLRIDDGELVMVDRGQRTELAGIVGSSPVMQQLMDKVAGLADSDATVLLLGESGTGKELIARALHALGPRRDGPFVTVDCGAVPDNLFASELFGHERGAFTGADRAFAGAFERADGGTLFLDEIAELPADQQVGLLGVLERRRVRRVGGEVERPVNVRVMSATHRDLRSEVNAGSFRLDLYYRLAVVLLRVPPLRDRPEDIPALVELFLKQDDRSETPGELFDPEGMRALQMHRWPGNVRELRNVVTAALATGETPSLDAGGLARPTPAAGGDQIAPLLNRKYKEARRVLLDEFEERYVRRLLERSEGNVRKGARLAGMDRSYLNDLLKRHGVR
jgi:DNA-binding NtrC family response regulator